MEFALKSVNAVMTPTRSMLVGVFHCIGRNNTLKTGRGNNMPKIASQAKRLRIYIGEADHWQQHSLYHAIVTKAKELDMAGATVLRGLMGYGANSRIHTASIVDLSSDLPVLVEIIDSEEYINKLLPYLDEMLEEGMITIDDIEVIKYGKQPPRR